MFLKNIDPFDYFLLLGKFMGKLAFLSFALYPQYLRNIFSSVGYNIVGIQFCIT